MTDATSRFYGGLADIAVKMKPRWQAFAAAIVFRVPEQWVSCLKPEKIQPDNGNRVKAGSRRWSEDSKNHLKHFMAGV